VFDSDVQDALLFLIYLQ